MAKMSDSLHVAASIHTASIRLLRLVRAADAETGLSAPKLSALSVLVFGGPQSLSSLAHAEQVRAPTMSKLVADLEGEGLVVKQVDAEDKRGVRVEVTVKGRALMEEGRKRRLSLLQKQLAKLRVAERETLLAASVLMMRIAQGGQIETPSSGGGRRSRKS